jgi:uncharacterized membrane protein YdbT with pleckstrin-like domain
MIDRTCCARVGSPRNLFRGDPFDRVAYVTSVLQPGETVKVIGRLHWTVFIRSVLLAAVSLLLMVYGEKVFMNSIIGKGIVYAGWVGMAVAAVMFLDAAFKRWTTELSVTTHRVIYKRGFIWRHTVEMNMDKVETVNVDQSIMGRILGYGTIHVLGTGQGGIQSLHGMGAPITIRNAITAG